MKLKNKWIALAITVIGTAIAMAGSNSGPVSGSDQQAQATDLVGKQAQQKVDLFTGSFGYTVPINCPPARNGSDPSLVLAYSSGGDNGWCGMGWTLAIGSIERNVRDGFPMLYSSGNPASPLNQYDDTKGFMLDLFGKSAKLFSVATNSSVVEYRAETDTDFLRCFFDTTNDKWTVYDKSGIAYYFGETSGSRVVNPKTGWGTGSSATFHWALDQIVTPTGDWTTISYANNTSPFTGLTEQTLYPTQINYNGHTNYDGYSASFSPPNTITFQTAIRTNDWHFSYRSGFRTEFDRLLTNIVCQTSSQNVWSYQLKYGPSPATGRALLTNVVVYGYSGSTATPYLTNSFAYQANPNGVSFGSTIVWSNMVLSAPGGGSDPATTQVNQSSGFNYSVADLIDMDGDGLPDRVVCDPTTTPNRYLVQKNLGFLSTGGSFGSQYGFGPTSTGGGNPSDASPYPTNSGYSELNTANGRIRDLNGDGLPDRVEDYWRPFDSSPTNAYAPYTNFTIAFNTGGAFSSPTRWAITNVFDGPDPDTAYPTYECVEGGGTVSLGSGDVVQVGVGLFDLNGDLLPDRVMTGFAAYTSVLTNLFVQYNTSSNFTQMRLYPYKSQNMTASDSQTISHFAAFETPDSHFLDLNGDGLPDHVMWPANASNSGGEASHPVSFFAVEYNDGYSFESTNSSTSVPGAADQWPGVVAQANNGQITYNGITFYSDSIEDPPYSGLYDVNGDGLPDRVVLDQASLGYATTIWYVYLNNGHGFNTTPITLTNIENEGHYTVYSGTTDDPWWSPEGTGNSSGPNANSQVTALIDVNGDGLLDRVLGVYYSSSPSANYFLVQLNQGPYPDLLTNVNNGLGGNLAVTYNSSSTYDNRVDTTNPNSVSHMPFPRQVVSSVAESDGVNAPQITTYSYAAGYYDGPRREFHGFGVVTNTDPTLRTTVTYFHTGGGRNYAGLGEYQDTNSTTGLGNFAKMGMTYRVEEYGNDGTLYHVQVNQMNQDSLGNARYFPFTALTFDCDYPGGGTPYITATSFSYDQNTGNLTNKTEYGAITNFSPTSVGNFSFNDVNTADTRQTQTIYASLSGNSYIVDHPATNSLTDINNNVIQQSQYIYNSTSGTTTAKLTQIAPGYFATNGYGYNTYGIVSLKTNTVGVVTEITYDSTDNTFPATTRVRANPSSDGGSADFTTTMVYDARSGDVASSTDPAGLTMTNSFDAFLRPTETDKIPIGGGSAVWSKKYDYPVLTAISSGQAVNYTDVIVNDGVGGFTNRTYIDGFGRTLQTRIQGENSNYRVISTFYDGRGNAFLTTWPVFQSGASFSKPTTGLMAMWTGYDAYGRVATNRPVTVTVNGTTGAFSSVTVSGGDTGQSPLGVKTWSFVNGSDPWWIIFTDEDGKTRQYHLDALGRTNQIVEVDGSTPHTTYLNYDLADNLTSIVNAIGETNYWAFNNAGDLVAMADPYLGQWTYVRDYEGRVRVQTDARGDVVSNSYVNSSGYQDPLGRVQVQTVFGFNPTNSTLYPAYTNTYVYDSGDGSNTVYMGLLYETVDSQGYEKIGYDTLAHTLKSTRYLNINSKSYTTAFTYNTGDKVTSTVYPNNGPIITNQYFNGGTIKQVSLAGTSQNYYTVTANAYDEFGHVTNFVYGNGLSTTRAFYPISKRLESVTAGSVFTRTFTYTAGEDIQTLNGTGMTNISVTYDNLHRIKTYSGLSGSYAYDAVGNITNNIESGSSQGYGYGVRRPQAVKTVGTAKYLYDLCGNMIVRNGDTATPQSLVYDAENHLIRLAAAGTNLTLLTFGYDAAGARLWKWNNQNTTNLQVWIGNFYEEKGGKVLYHIFANGQQVCSFETNSALFGNSSDTNHVAYYYSEDNINSSCALSSGGTASQQEVNVYYPFGRTMAGTLQASFQVSRRFTGQILDAESGLYYFNARYYDPQLGRFTQPDSRIADLSNPQSYNRYSYCVNNPLRYTDPDGRAPSDWANAWSSSINRGASYISASPSHWIWNGTVGTLNSLVGGLAEPLRFGSTAGALSGSGHATAGQIALGTLQETTRAVAIIPVGAAIGKGTGALVSSLTADAGDEAAGELSSTFSGMCFVGNTLIATKDGFKSIQDIEPGDLVWSFDEKSGEFSLQSVRQTFIRFTDATIKLEIDGTDVECTPEHPFWVEFKGWTAANELNIGDKILTLSGEGQVVSAIMHRNENVRVYNFEVNHSHSYCVSSAALVVHNSSKLKPGDTGTYGTLKAQKRANGETEALDMDHQPSFAAQVAALEQQLGRRLTPEELAELKANTPAVATPREIHQGTSPTYGGRNTPEKIQQDASDLEAARARDKAAFDKAMNER